MMCSLKYIKYAQDTPFHKEAASSLGYNTEMSAMQGGELKIRN